MFVDAIARGRGVKPAAVRDGFGKGRTVVAKEAVKAGMADRVETMDQTLRRLGAGPAEGTAPAAAAEIEQRALALGRARLRAAGRTPG